jgi:hypothetical protein
MAEVTLRYTHRRLNLHAMQTIHGFTVNMTGLVIVLVQAECPWLV